MRLQKNQHGNVDPLLIPLVVSVVLVVGLAVFGIWSYTNYLDQKNNVADISAQAVQEAEAAQQETLEADFAEREKKPNQTFLSDSAIGSIEFKYPKTWSGYVEEKKSSSKPLAAIFHPKVVPADNTLYALRVFVDESSYASKADDYDKDVEDGLVTVKPITIAGVTGFRVNGQIDKDFRGALVVFPLRDKTVQIWTESEAYLNDYNKVIDSLTFEP